MDKQFFKDQAAYYRDMADLQTRISNQHVAKSKRCTEIAADYESEAMED